MYFNPFFYSPLILILVCSSCLVAYASSGDPDQTFQASAIRTNGSYPNSLDVLSTVRQTDGKILIGGTFTTVGRYPRKGIARLNTDGTVDTSFDPPPIDLTYSSIANNPQNARIYTIGLQPDGKILLYGECNYLNGEIIQRLVRLNADGSPDTAFNSVVTQELFNWTGNIYEIKVQSDGGILLGGDFSVQINNQGSREGGIIRLNPNGTFDSTFNEAVSGPNKMSVRKIEILGDGRMMVGGTGSLQFNNNGLVRLNGDGTIDFSFTGLHVSGTVYDFEMLSDGRFIIVGEFSAVGGVTVGRIARINSDSTVDLTFNINNTGGNQVIKSAVIEDSGKIVVGGAFTTFNGFPVQKVARLNSNGTIDNTFAYDETNDGTVNRIVKLENNKFFIAGEGGFWDRSSVLNADGSVSNPDEDVSGFAGLVKTIAVQTNGKILVGGRFETAGHEKRLNIVRYNTDGSVDPAFNSTHINRGFVVNKIVPLDDGKIIYGSRYDRTLIRLNSDGSKDDSFASAIYISAESDVRDLAVIPDGKIVAVGRFHLSNESSSIYRQIARLLPNGQRDSSFNIPNPDGSINKILVQPDGKYIIVGEFTQILGSFRGHIARLNSDGTLDASFNPPGAANGDILDVALQTDGKVVVVGSFTTLNGDNTKRYVGRLNSDGSLDTGFNQSASFDVNAVEIENDGRILIGGTMRQVGGVSRNGLARLNPDGSLDNTFQVGTGTDSVVHVIRHQTDGRILIGGEFTKYKDEPRIAITRILNDSLVPNRTDFDFDGDGRADIGVFRPSSNIWYQLLGVNYDFAARDFGSNGDVIAPADYDGDGKTDLGIFRPSSGDWWYLSSLTDTQTPVHWGQSGDIPRPADFDGDGLADFVVYRPSNNVWYRFGSAGGTSITQFGIAGDIPLVGDFDGDGKGDLVIYRPSTGDWWWQSSVDGQNKAIHWGVSTDLLAPGDYDGDGKTDIAVYRPTTGVWYIFNSLDGTFTIIQFGVSGDRPVPADYDGDGRADIAVYRPSTGVWYLFQSTNGFAALQFGVSSDIPIPNAFLQ